MNIQLYEPDAERSTCGIPLPFMRPSNFGSYVKLEDYEVLEVSYDDVLKHLSALEDKCTRLEDEVQALENELDGY